MVNALYIWSDVVLIFLAALPGSWRQTQGEMALPPLVRKGKTGRQESDEPPTDRSLHCLMLTPSWRPNSGLHRGMAGRSAGAGMERWLLITCSITWVQTWGIFFFYNQWLTLTVLFFLEMLKYLQLVLYYGFMIKHGSNQWVWGASKMVPEKLWAIWQQLRFSAIELSTGS